MKNMAELFDMYSKDMVKPRISARLPMQDAARALQMIADRKVLGKVVLTT
jgi:NADPH2:quinone reductase